MPASPEKTIFVTGGRGRLGTLIADHFRAPAFRVELFSRTPSRGFHPLGMLTQSDAMAQADVVLHLAWSTLPASSELTPGAEQTHDLPLLDQLLSNLAALPQPRRPLFVFFSTGGAVYGNAPGRPSREDDKRQPIGNYGRAKRCAEDLLLSRAAGEGIACTILRISNPYGYPVPRNRLQGLIPHALRCAAEDQLLSLWGDGTARKDFLYYTDFLSALGCVIEQRLTGVFNLSAGESHSVREVLDLVEEITGHRLRLAHQPAPSWDVQDSRLDNTRFKTASGWSPQVSLADGIRRAAAGYALR